MQVDSTKMCYWKAQVHLELLEGPYIGGVDLAACGYSVASFGEGAPLPEAALGGPWHAESSARFALGSDGALVGEPTDGLRCCLLPLPPLSHTHTRRMGYRVKLV